MGTPEARTGRAAGWALAVALAALVAVAVARSGPASSERAALAQQTAGGAGRVVRTGGEGVVRVRPDVARLQLGVETRAATAQKAQADNARAAQAVVEAIVHLGVAREDVQTAWVNLGPEYDYSGRQPRLVGYRAANQVQVTVRDLALVGRVVDAAVEAGANSVSGIAFGLADEAAVRRQALARAVADARARAEAMARSAGAAVGEVLSLAEADLPVAIPEPAGRMRAAYEQAAPAATPVEPGELEMRVRVAAEFALR